MTCGERAEADFSAPESGVWPPEHHEREQWMGHVGKKPFAPWADRDHPEADADEDARWKWGLTENYVDVDTVALAEADPHLDGRAFLQQPDDPFTYVDGDDVRDPETGAVHPGRLWRSSSCPGLDRPRGPPGGSMTRKSKRELERAVEVLDGDDDAVEAWGDAQIVFVDHETGEHRTPDGERIGPDETDPLMVIEIGSDLNR